MFVQSGPQGVAISVKKRKRCVNNSLHGWCEWIKEMYGCCVNVCRKSLAQGLHEWIEQLCDPEENFCETLRAQLDPGWEEEEDQDVRVSGFVKSNEYTTFHIIHLNLVLTS